MLFLSCRKWIEEPHDGQVIFFARFAIVRPMISSLRSLSVAQLTSWAAGIILATAPLSRGQKRKEKTLMPTPHSMFFKMLSSKSRVQILKLLHEHEDLTVEDLATHLGLTVPTVSRHLQLLRMQGLVTFNQDAQTRYYEVNDKEIAERIAAFLQDLEITLPKA